MKRWTLSLLAVLFSATLAAAQQQPTTPVTPQRGDIPQIVAFDNEGLLGDHIHIFGNTPDLGKWGNKQLPQNLRRKDMEPQSTTTTVCLYSRTSLLPQTSRELLIVSPQW